MANNSLGYQQSPNGKAPFGNVIAMDAALRVRSDQVMGAAVVRSQSDQLTRDMAEIERAAAALCKAEPALQVWTAAPNDPLAGTPHSPWRAIGLVWFSTVLVTGGAIAAITQLAGQAAGHLFGQ